MAQSATANRGTEVYDYKLNRVIVASSAGTTIEWYDLYIFASLFAILGAKFFPPGNRALQLLGTFALVYVGFLVRPFGAFFFGRIGDLIGRKYTFMITITIMGLATFAIGFLPTYETAGIITPIILVILRCLQGLALGGEYGGAAIYVAEHAPDDKRGHYTSYIQMTATLGLVLALAVIVGTQEIIGTESFEDQGWRIPFLLSGILVALALYIRLSLRETPLYTRIKEAKQHSTAPIKDAMELGGWKRILLVLLGATAGQAVVWYTGQFYALVFMQTELGLSVAASSVIVGVALLLGTPFFLVFGKLSDGIGRKKIIIAGCLIAAITYLPLFRLLETFSDPLNYVAMIAVVFIMMLYVTMVYGPIAAYLVELFPARVRYTSLSVPYHLGNGWFGGGVPFIATFLVQRLAPGEGENTVDYQGLIYPIAVALMTAVVGTFTLRETRNVRIWDEVDAAAPATADKPAVVDLTDTRTEPTRP
ncbi:MAG: MHS family MFS transporter [Actinomycetota bacterium]|nr:MHS family MFS transporter [Actinomycetota bacterium]